MFEWPAERDKIVEYIKEGIRNKYDMYWCPTVFNGKRRVKENLTEMDVLYADLDERSPHDLPEGLKPSMVWESSPGRYAALWHLDQMIPAHEAEKYNKNLTYHIGADKGGWDLTQVLRIPGLANHKYEGSPEGKLLWLDDYRTSIEIFKNIPQVAMDDLVELEYDEILVSDASTMPDLVRPYLKKLNTKTLELLFMPEDEVLLYDRSEKLWELECTLLEAGIPQKDVVNLVAASNWNKYKGRKDETKRITSEVAKAAEKVDIPVDANYDRPEKEWTSYSELMGRTLRDPGWLIEGVWQRSSHGMIAGEPKTYKSVLATDMAVAVASGEPFLGKYAVHQQGPVMYIQEENSPWLVQDRNLKIANSRGLLNGEVKYHSRTKMTVKMPKDLPIYYLNNQGFDLTSQEDKDFLEESIKEIKPVLIIFDPLYLMLGGSDENSSKDIRPLLSWLLKIRYEYRTSIIVLHHWNKSGKSERGGQRMLGSVLWHGWVESAMYTSVVNEVEHEIQIDREFRSFEKPPKVNVKFKFGKPGDDFYEARIGDALAEGDIVEDLLSSYPSGLTEQEIKDYLQMPMAQLQKRLKGMIKAKKVKLVGTKYMLDEGEEE